ncbi:MAG TPA: hypothetical protein VN697_07050, partial [Tepidiformaceae bacterium]|nr:hypothetical protein [Tepidiformaceae bacterium]
MPEEAALLREARDRLFAGESMRDVCFDFQAWGVVSTAGNAWRTQSIKFGDRGLSRARVADDRDEVSAI